MASKSKLFDKYLGRFHRNSQMNKVEHEVVHQGWMTKSPPQRKLFGRTVSRGKWKRRNFVLCKPAGSLPGQVELNYYSDEHCTRKKGTIDLEQCDQIIESLNSDHFRNLFAIKTVCKSKERTYYLATETESEMSRWVRNLCSVCGLKQEDSPEDIPEPQRDRQKEKTTQPQMMTRVPVNQSSNFERQVSTDSYIPLDQCRSGNPATSRRDSIPDETAPSPPLVSARGRPTV